MLLKNSLDTPGLTICEFTNERRRDICDVIHVINISQSYRQNF